ncbi:hypothetical protein [Halobacillus sp. Marseille-Q1614]|uniref:hypothetical protein n=1 Tax=Halobacillus sp. Marseille-Q1614 TaxID=2709134 RepID=UPI00156D6C65|nr:hypothetical protein [Halobacillus sp. Marseille-Q1614]
MKKRLCKVLSFVVFLFTGYAAPSEDLDKLAIDSKHQAPAITEVEAYYEVVPAEPPHSTGVPKESDPSFGTVPVPWSSDNGDDIHFEDRREHAVIEKDSGFLYARKYQSSYLV